MVRSGLHSGWYPRRNAKNYQAGAEAGQYAEPGRLDKSNVYLDIGQEFAR
jgi:hypothetical protein